MVEIGNKAMEAFNQSLLPGKFLCNQIPACALWSIVFERVFAEPILVRHIPAWVPGAGFKSLAVEWKKLVSYTTCQDVHTDASTVPRYGTCSI